MVQLVVHTQDSVTLDLHYLDLGDVSIKANFSSIEIQDITTRKSESTQAFSLPFTITNNKFFSHFYNVNSDGTFNVNQKASARIIVDGSEILDGYLQLLSVNTKSETYEVVVLGEVANIVKELAEDKLSDLDLSEWNHVFNHTNVFASWNGAISYVSTLVGDQILYPIIDFGYDWDLQGTGSTVLSTDRLKPSIKVRTVFDTILGNLGYTINSTFLDSDFFTNQYMTLANDTKAIENGQTDGFRVFHDASVDRIYATYVNPRLHFINDSGGTAYDTNNNYTTTSGTDNYYTIPANGHYKFKIRLSYDTQTAAAGYNSYTFKVHLKDVASGAGFAHLQSMTLNADPSGGIAEGVTASLALEQGMEVAFYFEDTTNGGGSGAPSTYTDIMVGSYVQLLEAPVQGVGAVVDLSSGNNIMPKDKQIDFITSILSRYNLILERDSEDPKQLNIEPAQDYFDAGSSKDWTNKLDVSKDVIIKPTHEYQKKALNLRDLEDEDWLCSEWQKTTGVPYNTFELKFNQDFHDGGVLEVKSIFSSFPTFDKDGLKIAQLYKWDNDVPVYVETKPKLFYYSGLKDCAPIKFFHEFGNAAVTWKYQYPFCSTFSMASNVITSTDDDIRFKSIESIGEADIVASPTQNDTYKKCWEKYLNSIYGDDARIMIASFNLTSVDIADFKYNDKIFIKDAYYRVNKINSFAVGKETTTQVELIKILAYNGSNEILGCNLKVTSIAPNGVVSFVDEDGVSQAPTRKCCEGLGYTLYPYSVGLDICIANQSKKTKYKLPEVTSTNSVVKITRAGTDVEIEGNVKRLGPVATDGQLLSYDGTNEETTWIDPLGSGGSNTEIMYNKSGVLEGDPGFTYTEATNLMSNSGDISAASFQGNNIGSGAIQAAGGTKYWYLSPQDFLFGNSNYRNNYTDSGGFSIKTWQYYTSYGKLVATIFVPEGYKVISCFIKGSANWTWSAGVTGWSSVSGVGTGSGVVNTEATGLNWTFSSVGNYYSIQISGASGTDTIYGARLTLEAV